jgi:putative membrane protein
MEWKNLYRGMIMGAVDVIPGISGGTIAILLGIYERLINAINGFFSKEWKRQLGFIIPLLIGMGIAIFLFANVIEWLFINHPTPTLYFFLGLILGVLPFLLNKVDAANTFRAKHFVFMLIGIIVVAGLGFLSIGEGDIITSITPSAYFLLFVSGIVASSAMILPGISGSFMLLVLGVYPTVISAVSNLKLNILLAIGLGILLGFIVMSRILGYFLKNHYTLTFATTIGLVIGSVFVIFPGIPESLDLILISLFTLLAGLITAYILGRIEYK